MKYLNILLLLIIFSSCNSNTSMNHSSNIDWQGHRGCRGLLPENTIPAFIKAIDLGVNTLELDVAVSKDQKIIVSHEPWMSGGICITPENEPITEEMEQQFKIYEMDYELISTFDCGSIGNSKFPEQKGQVTHKPSLNDMFLACEKHIVDNKLQQVNYNIEIKSKPEWDSIYCPTPDVFSDLLVNEIKASGIDIKRFCLQSFDTRILKYLHKNHPDITLAYLIEYPYDNTEALLDKIAFTPSILSPYYKLLDQQKIETAQQMGMKVIPWTVNTEEEMEQLIDWGIDGIITDYPNIPLDKQ